MLKSILCNKTLILAISTIAILGLLASFLLPLITTFSAESSPIPTSSYAFHQQRQQFQTTLTNPGPSPIPIIHATPPEHVSIIQYQSDGLTLNAWLALPSSPTQNIPALVYFNEGPTFDGIAGLQATQPFLDAGYAVLLPILRGDHNQPGHHELMYAEINDALAASKWLAKHPQIDPTKTFAFGNKLGGNIAAMLTLFPGSPIHTAAGHSSLYLPNYFETTNAPLPFDPTNRFERELRVFTPHINDMLLPYIAYIATEDTIHTLAEPARETARKHNKPLTIHTIPDNPQTSLETAIQHFLKYTNQIQ